MSNDGSGDLYAGRIPLGERTLREHTARGTLINAGFLTALSFLGLLKAFVVAAFLTPEDYGIWGILLAGIVTLSFLSELGVGDKYIQQTEVDQELAFDRAFTLNLIVNLAFTLVMVAAVPLLAVIYGQPDVLAPGLVLALAMPAAGLLSPLWIYYRRMQFVRQRALQAIDPVVGFAVTVALAIAGMGYWSLVVGAVAGTWSAALVTLATSPYRPRLRLGPGVRDYLTFSWPLVVANVNRLLVVQAPILVGEWQVGLAAAGAITLGGAIIAFTQKVDAMVTQTIYPAVCAVRDQTALLFETFVKSNRLVLIWGVPFGLALLMFAPDLVDHVLGEKWEPAVGLLQAYGLISAFSHVGFNWDAFFRARGETKPIAAVSTFSTAVFLAVAIPLLAFEGLSGFAVGMAVYGFSAVVGRTYFLTRIFDGFGMARHAARALLPAVPAVAVVALARLLESGERSGLTALAEFCTFVAVAILATALAERDLLREMFGYLRRARGGSPAPAA
ncbi:MAG TPA: oligosaccharide flippase family protein [Thermoleophilaceae bacterium]|nr:oligosaccharide flippase family protein [Thermoleophilaceae bacterium]